MEASKDLREDLAILIPGAGAGLRLGRGPKAFLELEGRPLAAWVARKARTLAAEVIVAVPPGLCAAFAAACPGCRVLEGGESRQDSVARLVEASTRPLLLLQDAARPFASLDLMRAVAAAAAESGAAGAFLEPDVPVARLLNGRVVEAFEPDQVGIFQAPQAFARELLVRTLALADARGWKAQSTLQLVLRAGIPVRAVPGEKTNLKVTTEEDWKMAAGLVGLLA